MPEEWKVVKMSKCVESSAFGPRFSSDLYSENGNVATLRTTDMDDQGRLNLETMPLADLELNSFVNHILQEEDIVIPRSGTIGITGLFPGYHLPVVPGAFLIQFRLKKAHLLPIYITYYFNSVVGRRRIMNIAGDGVQKNLKGSSVLSLSIPLPPPRTKKIAAILSTWDTAIQKLEQLIAKKQELKRGLMQQLLTGRRRFPEFVPAGGTKYKETKLGLLPVEWEIVKLGEVTEKITDGAHKSPPTSKIGYPIATVENINKGYVDIKSCRIISNSDYAELVRNGCKPEKGDVLLSKDGTIGISFVYQDNYDLILLSSIAIIRPNKVKLDSNFVNMILLSSFFYHHLHRVVAGSALNRIVLRDIRAMPFFLPSLSEQRKIAKILTICDQEINHFKEEKKRLYLQKKGLMQQLLTGAVRVNTTVSQT